jgi:hypothetical protein
VIKNAAQKVHNAHANVINLEIMIGYWGNRDSAKVKNNVAQ